MSPTSPASPSLLASATSRCRRPPCPPTDLQPPSLFTTEKVRLQNPHRLRAQAAHKASLAGESADPSAPDAAPVPTAPKRQPVQMPDEYLPANPTLFVQGLVEGITKDMLEEVFGKSVRPLGSARLGSPPPRKMGKRC